MDDNKILTLANNERIQLQNDMRMLFEIKDVRYATPATISRAGILYVSDESEEIFQNISIKWMVKTMERLQNYMINSIEADEFFWIGDVNEELTEYIQF